MRALLNNRKVVVITLLILAIGIVLQLSRSSWILNSIKNEQNLTYEVAQLQPARPSSLSAFNPTYCIVYNNETDKLKTNIAKTLDYIQKPYKLFDTYLGKVDYLNCPNILLTTPDLKDLGSVDEIKKYVSAGGNLFFMSTLEPDNHYKSLYRLFGVIDYFGFIETTGIKMTSNVLIGAENKTFWDENLEDNSLNIVLDTNIKRYVENSKGTPLLWKSPYGEGNFITMNSSIISEKNSRGMIVGMLGLNEKSFIYPIFNTKTFFIDDFPAPIAKGKNDIIYNEYKQDLPNFYRNVWWSDMIQVANKHNIIYTGALIESYNDQVKPPYSNSEDKELTYLIGFGRELLQSGGEIGFHGYNHQSLTLDKKTADFFSYNVWPSTDAMKQSLHELSDYTQTAFPSYTVTSYVPPSNVLSKEGRIVLRDAFPDLITIASLYSEDYSNLSYVQEFEIAEDLIIEMPRISSGYYPSFTNEWEIANAITSLGVFSHFIHPDDVISEDRSKGGWSEMYEEFEQFIGDINEHYPWLEAMTATNAAFKTANVLNSTVSFNETDKSIEGTISNFNKQQDFILKTIKKIKSTKNCTYEKIESDTYLVKASAATFNINFK